MRLAITLLLSVGLLGVARAQEKLQVASLSTVLTDIAQNVGGDHVTVTPIVKPGIDPHDFEPSPGDLKTISKARIVLASGLGFEHYLDKLEKSTSGANGPTFVVVGKSVKIRWVDAKEMAEESDHDHDHGHGQEVNGRIPDPHWFHSIANAKIATNVIRDAFAAADPADKAAYFANAKAYQAKLDELASWAKLQVAKLPASKRKLVTSHDALGYFARDYDFTVYPIEGISTADEPSSKKVRDIVEEVKKDGVKSIFFENIENPKVLTEITRETGAQTGGVIYADGLGDKEATTYLDMVRHNVSTIVNGLQ